MIADILHKVACMDKPAEQAYHPRPSLAGPERCIRSLVYNRLGIKKKQFPGRTLMIFDDGIWGEEITLDWISKTSYQVSSSQMKILVTLSPALKIPGSIDGIITDLTGYDRVLELKHINHFSFERYRNQKALPLDYITQCCLYVRGCQDLNPDITEALLLLKNKNTAAYLEYVIRYDTEHDTATVRTMAGSQGEEIRLNKEISAVLSLVKSRFEEVEDYANQGRLPLRPYEPSDWQCEYCQWGAECYKNYVKEFQEKVEGITLESSITEEVQMYVFYKKKLLEIKKAQDIATERIKVAMREQNSRLGKAGDYEVKIRLQERKYINKELIPMTVLDRVTEIKYSEILNIREVKDA